MSAADTPNSLSREQGRAAFGADAANYDAARPEYPVRVFDLLAERCGLAFGTAVFELGPGTGLATRRLIERGAAPLVAIEPDARLAAKLAERSPGVEIIHAPFEDADLGSRLFDLGASATAFHWVEQRTALAKVATLLRQGGWWAMWWNVFGDSGRADPFHVATQPLLAHLGTTPSWTPAQRLPFALDRDARFADLEATGAFDDIAVETLRWTLVLDPAQLRALYATYSHLSVLEAAERDRILDGLQEIAATEFAGRVARNMVTPIYTARRS